MRSRQIVASNKRRFVDGAFDLDLTYVTSNIIAMSWPAGGQDAMFRNPRSEVLKFLDSKHLDDYYVYNLCSERKYEASVFHGRVKHIPFDDHNPPTLAQIVDFTTHSWAWLRHDSLRRVVSVHCKVSCEVWCIY